MDLRLNNCSVSEFSIKKGRSYSHDDLDCRWYDITFNIKNDYFSFNETHEDLLQSELWEIYHTLNKCLNNKLEKDKNLFFVEPTLEMVVSIDKWIDIRIYLYDGESDYYSFTLYEEQMIRLRDYLKEAI